MAENDIAQAQIQDLLSENERVRMEKDAIERECASLRDTVRGQVEADLLLASFRIISDLVLKHEPSPQDTQTQVDGVHALNAMRVYAQASGRPHGPTNLQNPFERRSKNNGTDVITNG